MMSAYGTCLISLRRKIRSLLEAQRTLIGTGAEWLRPVRDSGSLVTPHRVA
jgi:hypothetical protein